MSDPGPPPGGPPRLGRERSDADTTRVSFLLRPGDTESHARARLLQAITQSATSQTQPPDAYPPRGVLIHWGPAGDADERRDDATYGSMPFIERTPGRGHKIPGRQCASNL